MLKDKNTLLYPIGNTLAVLVYADDLKLAAGSNVLTLCVQGGLKVNAGKMMVFGEVGTGRFF